jgi:predicted RNA-binding protein with PUA-like domain
MAEPRYWLIKSEPDVYPYSQLENERRTAWTGIRNFEARNNLRQMKPGDLALYYHSGEGKEIVGVAKIVSDPVPDPTAPKEDWASVEVEPLIAFPSPVSLAQIKGLKEFSDFSLVTRSRLSVIPVQPKHFKRILTLAKASLP